MLESKIDAQGRTTLPKAVRDALALQPGDRVRYFIMDKEVWVLKVRPIERLCGSLRHDGPTVTLEDMENAIAAGAIESL